MTNENLIITFHLDGDLYGLPICALRVLEASIPYTPIPGSPSHMMGVANLRGQIITIVNLANIYNLNENTEGPSYLLALKSIKQLLLMDEFHFNDQAVENEDNLAIHVGTIEGILPCPPSEFDLNTHHLAPERRPFVSGILKTSNQLVTVFNPASLIQHCQNTLKPTKN